MYTVLYSSPPSFKNLKKIEVNDIRKWNFESKIRIPESKKFLLVESGILGFWIRNTAQGIGNPTNNWNPESKFHWQESSTWNPESTEWNPESKIVLDSLSKAIWRTNVKQRLCYRLATKEVKRCNKYIITSYMAVFGSPIRYDSTVVLDVQEKQQSRKEGSETNNNTTQYWFLWPCAFITMPLGLMG